MPSFFNVPLLLHPVISGTYSVVWREAGGGGGVGWGTGQLPTSTHGFDVAVNTVGP